MKIICKLICSLALASMLLGSLVQAEVAPNSDAKKPVVQMAILLDTSSSMSGLIDQARTQLWKVVNQFIVSVKDGQRPDIQVALFEYGKSSLDRSGGYIRMISPLTTDLDKISEDLFALTTNGGDEYCGQVIQRAVEKLSWSSDPEDLKVIFIAGNEPFTQGPVDYRQACQNAIKRGITVNTIHCGADGVGVSGKWKDGALLADGSYLSIDHNRKVQHIAAPQDKEIARLGAQLNETYLPFGGAGVRSHARQEAQDMNATKSSGGSMTQRAVFKSSGNYYNPSWDLVDALEGGKVKLEDMKEADLPEKMKKLSPAQRKALIESYRAQRKELQGKISTLNTQRKKFVAEKRRRLSKTGEQDTLDTAMVKSVRKQAAGKNFKFADQ